MKIPYKAVSYFLLTALLFSVYVGWRQNQVISQQHDVMVSLLHDWQACINHWR